jgi:hypothetical protein
MRLFSDKEKELINRFLQFKKDNDIVALQVAKFIRESLDCFAMKYQMGDKPQIVFYSRGGEKDKKKVNQNYTMVCDFIYFLQELERYDFIKFQRNVTTMIDNNVQDYVLLYDREKYKYVEEADNFIQRDVCEDKQQIELLGKVFKLSPVQIYRVTEQIDKVYLDFVKDLMEYGNAIIYPLPLLEDFAAHNFKDLQRIELEEARKSNRESQVNTLKSIRQTRCGIIISAIAVAISLIAIIVPIFYEAFWSDSPSGEDMQNIQSAIERNQSIQIESMELDTLNVRVTEKDVDPIPINLKVNVTSNQ